MKDTPAKKSSKRVTSTTTTKRTRCRQSKMTVTTAKRNCSWSAGLPCNSTSEWARQEDLNGTFQLRNDYFEQLRREGAKKRATTKQNKAKRQLMVEVRMQEQHRETDTKIPCPVCNKSCKGEKGLAMHQRRAHQ